MKPPAEGDRISIATSRGDIEVDSSEIVHFPEGLIGFEDWTDFAILDIKDCPPFKSMLSVGEGGPDFVVIEPMLVFDDLAPLLENLPRDAAVSDTAPDDMVLLSIVTLSDRPEDITVNLKGPIVLDLRTRSARQVIFPDDRCKTKVPLLIRE
jgi:flagellar assembly factor FliW